MKTETKLKGKDLANIGIYAAIYFVITMLLSFTGYVPVMLLLLIVLVPVICTTPFMLFLTKVRNFGMITIFSVIIGLLMGLTGMGFFSIFTGLIFGLIADVIAKKGDYTNKRHLNIATVMFNGWIWGNYLPFYLTREAIRETYTAGGRGEYVEQLFELCPMWTCPVLLIVVFISAIVGIFVAGKLLKKHFTRAGIA